MKKSLLLFTGLLLTVVGCANANSANSNSDGSSVNVNSSSPSFDEDAPVKYGYSNLHNYKVDANFKIDSISNQYVIKDAVHLLDDEECVVIRNSDEKNRYSKSLESKISVGKADYLSTISFLNDLDTKAFNEKTLVMTPEMTVYTHGIEFELEGIYLKDQALYIHIVEDDHSFHHRSDSSPIYDMYQVCTFFVNKDVIFNSTILVMDYITCK